MTTHTVEAKGAELFVKDHGLVDGDTRPVLLFAHCLGLDHRVWHDVVPYFPDHRCVRYDLRGHGYSDAPDGPYAMGTLVSDAEAVCAALDIKDSVFVGLSVGGLVAQGLAVKRLDLVRGLVLCATAAKFGQAETWYTRAAAARSDGMASLWSETQERWGVAGDDAERLEKRFCDTSAEGFAATCEAIAGTDFYSPTSGLRLPALGLCGDRDKSTPPDLVRETVALIPGSEFHLIKGAGHVLPETHAQEVAKRIHAFLSDIGHV